MKIARLAFAGRPTWGVVKDGFVSTLPMASTIVDAIQHGRALRDSEEIAISKVQWIAPILPDAKVICAGLNYRKHLEEMGRNLPQHPSVFIRFPDSLVGHEQEVIHPRVTDSFDYEAELAIVIGKTARYVDESNALSFVAGYTCMAENSARDFQRHNTQATPGKNFDKSGALGPWITTVDEIENPDALDLLGRLNGVEVQRSNTDDMIFSVSGLIAYISSFTTLRPGDVVATGTPEGVGMTRTPPLYMKPGDVFEVEIPAIGKLTNRVADERGM